MVRHSEKHLIIILYIYILHNVLYILSMHITHKRSVTIAKHNMGVTLEFLDERKEAKFSLSFINFYLNWKYFIPITALIDRI